MDVLRNPKVKTVLRQLHADRRNVALAGLIVTHAIWLAAVFLAVWIPNGSVTTGAFFLIGFMQYRIVMSCHEATHKTLLFPERLNEAVGVLHCAMVGINFIRYRRQHLEHHRARTIRTDPDAYIYEPILAAPPGWRRTAVWLGGAFGEIIEKIRQKGAARETSSAHARQAPYHTLAIIAAQVFLGITFTLIFGWWGYPLLWLGPLLTVALLINRTRITVEHGAPHLDLAPEGIADANQETLDILTNPVERFLFAPYAFNYHHAHHAIQSVPHYHNARLSRLLEENAPEPSHRVRATYLGLLFRTLWRPTATAPRPTPTFAGVEHAHG